jgi:hypothetical protein
LNPSILRHTGIRGAADEAVLKINHKIRPNVPVYYGKRIVDCGTSLTP